MLRNSRLIKNKDKIEKQTGKKIDIPELTTTFEYWVFSMFRLVHGQRLSGEPLKISEIYSLMCLKNVPVYERTPLLEYILTLDHVYLEWEDKKRKREQRRKK
jgi:hypothetical protein